MCLLLPAVTAGAVSDINNIIGGWRIYYTDRSDLAAFYSELTSVPGDFHLKSHLKEIGDFTFNKDFVHGKLLFGKHIETEPMSVYICGLWFYSTSRAQDKQFKFHFEDEKTCGKFSANDLLNVSKKSIEMYTDIEVTKIDSLTDDLFYYSRYNFRDKKYIPHQAYKIYRFVSDNFNQLPINKYRTM